MLIPFLRAERLRHTIGIRQKMTTTNPIIPPDSPLNKPSSARLSKFSLAVFAVLAVHVALLAGLLFQGCKRDDRPPAPDADEFAPTASLTTNAIPLELVTPVITPLPQAPPIQELPQELKVFPQAEPVLPAQPPPPLKTYVVAKGDTFLKIARAHKISLDALVEANPEIDPSMVQVGRKINIPSGNSGDAQETSKTGKAGSEGVYVVKSGDTLTRIAKNHGTTPAALKEANDMTTDRILVGQRLRIPRAEKPRTEL
jgi:LysM repeat protein